MDERFRNKATESEPACPATKKQNGRQGRFELQNRLLTSIVEAQALAFAGHHLSEIFSTLLERSLEITGSTVGFMGEVLFDPDSRPYLRTYALSDISWNKESKAMYQRHREGGLEFHNLETLFGAALRTGEPVISNFPAEDVRSGGLPPGHLPIKSFLAIPILGGGRLVGLIGLANKLDGFQTEDIQLLEPLLSTCSTLILIGQSEVRRVEAESKLRMSEADFEYLFEYSPVGKTIALPTGDIRANRAFYEMLGYSKKEGHLLSWQAITHPDDLRLSGEVADSILAGEKDSAQFVKRYIHKDGSVVWAEINTRLRRDDHGQPMYFVAAAVDITRRKEAEEERVRLLTAIEQTAEAIVITDPLGIIQYVNPAFEKITGFSRGEAIGQNPRILKSGEQNAEFYKRLWSTISKGRTFQGRVINRRRDGVLYTEEMTISPVVDTNGEIVDYVAVKRDITEQLRLTTHLQRVQRLESLGTLAGGIAHDFNNILAAILGYAAMAQQEIGEQGAGSEELKEVLIAGKRAAELIQQILAISRQTQPQRQPVKIQSIINEVMKLLRPSISSFIRLESQIDPSCPDVIADPSEIHQLVMNLCTNARDAIQEALQKTDRNDHSILLKLESVDLGKADLLRMGAEIPPGPFVSLAVSDTGCGIDAPTLTKIFDPYFTTKTQGKGTGLGLAIVHAIVTGSGGLVYAESIRGKGSTFRVLFPEHIGSPVPEETEESPTKNLSGTERIMVIDDEEPVSRLFQRILSGFGYQVTSFTSGEEALAAFLDGPEAIDLVITDMNMPGIRGTEVARRLIEARPGMPILLCTGFSEGVDRATANKLGIKAIFHKPVDAASLVTLVRRVLDSTAVD